MKITTRQLALCAVLTALALGLSTLGNTAVLGYLPFLLAVSLFTGALTGFVSALLLRAISHVKL